LVRGDLKCPSHGKGRICEGGSGDSKTLLRPSKMPVTAKVDFIHNCRAVNPSSPSATPSIPSHGRNRTRLKLANTVSTISQNGIQSGGALAILGERAPLRRSTPLSPCLGDREIRKMGHVRSPRPRRRQTLFPQHWELYSFQQTIWWSCTKEGFSTTRKLDRIPSPGDIYLSEPAILGFHLLPCRQRHQVRRGLNRSRAPQRS
jgi:hypothetical protein